MTPRDGWEPRHRRFFKTLGAVIRARREFPVFMSQEELARRSGLSRTSIVNIEGGNQRLPLTTLMDIARALDSTGSRLLEDAEGKRGSK